MEQLVLTASQTVGPFFAPCLLREGALRQALVEPQTEREGQRIRLEGRVLDGDGAEVPDALVEIWQADAEGHYRHSKDKPIDVEDLSFFGYGRSDTAGGGYWFETIKPGQVPFGAGKMQAPHIAVTIFARGLLNHLLTRLYFEDETANAEDPILQAVPEERRQTLVARLHQGEGNNPSVYRLDFVLQGEGETAFFQL